MGLIAVTFQDVVDRLNERFVVIVALVIAAFVADRVVRRLIPAAIRRIVLRQSTVQNAADMQKRADTLASVLGGGSRIAVLVIALLLLFSNLGVDVFPVVAGLGIGGIALGLGAQSLVKDAINGILILSENQYGKGDMVTIAGVQGWVEEVNLRRTILRDLDGTLHSVPNGEVKVSSNLTRGYSGINLLVSLAAGADVEKAITLIDATGATMAQEETLATLIVEPPHVARIEAVTATSVDLRVLGRVTPGAQWRVTGTLRQRLLATFEAGGIKFGPVTAAPPPAPPPRA